MHEEKNDAMILNLTKCYSIVKHRKATYVPENKRFFFGHFVRSLWLSPKHEFLHSSARTAMDSGSTSSDLVLPICLEMPYSAEKGVFTG